MVKISDEIIATAVEAVNTQLDWTVDEVGFVPTMEDVVRVALESVLPSLEQTPSPAEEAPVSVSETDDLGWFPADMDYNPDTNSWKEKPTNFLETATNRELKIWRKGLAYGFADCLSFFRENTEDRQRAEKYYKLVVKVENE